MRFWCVLVVAAAVGVPASALAAEASPSAKALSAAVFDFCVPVASGDIGDPARVTAAGILLLPGESPAAPQLFPGATTMQGFFALQPTAPDAPYVDGLTSAQSPGCVVRLVNAPMQHEDLVRRLSTAGSGWTRVETPSSPGGPIVEAFRKPAGGEAQHDVLVSVSHQQGAPGPGGMSAFVQVRRVKKDDR